MDTNKVHGVSRAGSSPTWVPTGAAGTVAIGHRLGLYPSLAEGPATPEQFADRTGYDLRYLTEWLRVQAAGGYASLRPGDRGSSRSPRSRPSASPTRTDPTWPRPSSPALGYLRASRSSPRRSAPGEGVGWHEHHEDVFVGCDAFYRPGYVAELVPNWIPALEGVEAKLTAGRPGSPTSAAGWGRRLCCSRRRTRRRRSSGRTTTPSPSTGRGRRPRRRGSATGSSFEVASADTFGGTGTTW